RTDPLRDLSRADALQLLNRVTWGATPASLEQLQHLGVARYLDAQLQPNVSERLPAEIQSRIAAMTISREPIEQLVPALADQQKDANALDSDDAKREARRAYQQALTRLSNEAATRSLLRAIYSDRQLQEQLT